MPVRRRDLPFPGWGPTRYKDSFRQRGTITSDTRRPPVDASPSVSHLQGVQTTTSENHAEWKRNFISPPGDIGGDFTSQKRYCACPSIGNVHIDTGWLPYDVGIERRTISDGPCFNPSARSATTMPWPPYAMSSDTGLNAYGATAIARCAPGRPTVNLAAALLEAYHDGLPKLLGKEAWEKKTQLARDLKRSRVKRTSKTYGSEFLNYQFGWLPLVSDVTDFVRTVAHLKELLLQFERDNGQVVRRRYRFPTEHSITETVIASNHSGPDFGTNAAGRLLDLSSSTKGWTIRRRETTIDRWFSGAFVYHLPITFFGRLNSEFASKFQQYESMFGLELSPDVIWEIAPWSWAVDWFSNLGDVIHNAQTWANDGLVLKYGYIMEHSVVRDIYTYAGPTNVFGGSTARPADIILTSEAKVRRRANPFGFGLTMGNLSYLQKSILAAVGLTRLR